MMFAKRVKLYFLLMLIVLLPIVSFASSIGRECPKDLRVNSIGIPLCIKRETDLLYTGIQQIVASENLLYVLHNCGVVQVYSFNGEYLQSIAVFCHENGRIMIAAHNGKLYIKDKVGNVYVFDEGTFETFVSKDDAAQLIAELNFTSSDPNYKIKGSSIWSVNEEGVYELLVPRPRWLAIYQHQILSIIQIILILSIGALLFVNRGLFSAVANRHKNGGR